ncbi:MAG TPA: ChaN family lipoprotein [Vicinamibacterales bacterium]|nr:ChaN family lipoprotein [Vicinamibacterales bacterium]HOQ60257.1 ChaN family lipoprotein [Vicinamibacterales bacterium]HPK71402.1 ChaN family lipoprotein [Vicinamibacterales bacterium]HPW19963.1 ChaN family lipoprotein [Vicinamibacterales bacterium]
MPRLIVGASVLAAALVAPAGAAAQDASRTLAIGDPARKDRTVPVVVDGIVDTAANATIPAGELGARLKGVRVLFIGESHTDMAFHRVQLQVIRELQRRGREVLIGLEMYPYTEQAALDLWNAGRVGEDEFVEQSQWYKNWGYHWHYYRDIFLFARQHGIRIYAVNTPREVVSAVRRKGFQNLSPEESARIPPKIDTASEDHKTLFRAFFAGEDTLMHAMTGQMFDGMFAAQCTWDASMGFNAVQSLQKHGGPDAIMVVLIGSGHVAYNLGAQRQASLWFDGRMASIVPVAVADAKGRRTERVQASYADYVWGLPPEEAPLYPSLGISVREGDGESPLSIIDVQDDSVARDAGLQAGDVLQTMDGTPVKDRETLNRLLADKRWADAVTLTVDRRGELLTITAVFRRQPPPVK